MKELTISLQEYIVFRPHKKAEDLLGDYRPDRTGNYRMKLVDFCRILGPELDKGIIKGGQFKVLYYDEG